MSDEDEAPDGLDTVRRFINTYERDPDAESLGSPEELGRWLADHGLLSAGTSVGPAGLERARSVREALRQLARENVGEEADPNAWDVLNDASQRARLALRFGPHGKVSLEPLAEGIDGALGRLLGLAADAMNEGTWARLKACANDDCQWAFYDHARNRSGRWCDMSTCGNRAKARAFRARRREEPGTPPVRSRAENP